MNFKKILPLVGIIILIVILATLDLRKIFDIFSKINPLYSFLSFFVLVPLLLLVNIEWQLLLKKQKIHVSFLYSIKNFFIGYFYGFITPGGFGAYTRAIYLSDESKVPLPKCVSNIIIFNTVEFVCMMLVGAVGAIYLSSIFPYLFYTIIIILIVVVALFLFFFKTEKSKIWFTKIVQLRIFSTVKDRLEGSIDSFYEDIHHFKDVLLPMGISITGWFLKYVLLFFIAKLFLINIPLVTFIMIMAVADVIASIPISIYGIGTREAALIPLFLSFDPTISIEQIVSLSLFWFVVIWLTPSIIGAFLTLHEAKKSGKFILDEKTTEQFETYMKKYPDLYENLAIIVKRNIPKRAKKPVIVDLGVGPGLLSSEMCNQIPKAVIIGIDISENMLDVANKNVKKDGFQTMLGSSENIPIKNNVDVVVSRFSLIYWKNPIESFNEINRVLKSDGKIVFEVLNKDFPSWKLFLIKIKMFFSSASSNVIRYHINAYKTAYTIESVKSILKKTGFEVVSLEGDKKDWRFIVVAKKK